MPPALWKMFPGPGPNGDFRQEIVDFVCLVAVLRALNICTPAGKDRPRAWELAIQSVVHEIMNLSKVTTLTLLLPQREVEPEGVSAPAVCRVAPTSAAGNKKTHLVLV